MANFSAKDPGRRTEVHGAWSHPVFTPANAPAPGFVAGVNVVWSDRYPSDGVHEDNEGFYVIKGTGWAKVGGEERQIGEGSCFFAPAGVPHAIRKDTASCDLEVFLFHYPSAL